MRNGAKLAVLIAVLFTTACTASATRRSFGEGYRDSLTTSKIKWTMGRDKEVKAGEVNVDTWRGKVTLTGVVETEAEKGAAERIARNTKNVTDVRNYIEVVGSSVSLPATTKLEETTIAEKNLTKETKVSKSNVKPNEELTADDGYTEVKVTEETKTKALKEKNVSTKTAKASNGKKFKERIPEPITVAKTKPAKPEKAAKVKPVRQNAVSYEIGKELAATEDKNYYENDGKNVKSDDEYEDDVTLQAEKELMELKAKRGK